MIYFEWSTYLVGEWMKHTHSPVFPPSPCHIHRVWGMSARCVWLCIWAWWCGDSNSSDLVWDGHRHIIYKSATQYKKPCWCSGFIVPFRSCDVTRTLGSILLGGIYYLLLSIRVRWFITLNSSLVLIGFCSELVISDQIPLRVWLDLDLTELISSVNSEQFWSENFQAVWLEMACNLTSKFQADLIRSRGRQ